jgi:hypothetical protein
MARFLHLIKGDAPALARAAVERNLREPGAQVTVVLLDGAGAEAPAGATVRRLGADLDYDRLLDLIFEADHVVAW